MFVVRHRLTPTDGSAPALQYGLLLNSIAYCPILTFFLEGYGGFNIPINPYFSVFQLTFLQQFGAVLAVPNIRGGGEFGEDWHRGGIHERKVPYQPLYSTILYFIYSTLGERF